MPNLSDLIQSGSDSAKLLSTAVFAADQHRNQKRKDVCASPYINHPLQVASLLASAGVTDVELLMAAILHDTVEDTETSLDDLRSRFGERVASIVADVTDDKSLEKADRKRLQVESAAKKSTEAKQLKIADKTCNVTDIDSESPVGWDRDRRLAYLDWAENVVRGCRGVNEQLELRFDEAVDATRRQMSN